MSREFSFNRRGSAKAVLLLHGLTGSPSELVYLAKALYKAGYDVYCPVLPGHSGGLYAVKQPSWRDWFEFSLAKYDELKALYPDVYIMGLCLGATLSAAVAQERPGVQGIAMLAPLTRPDGWAWPWYSFLLPLALYTPLKYFYVFPEQGAMGVKNEEIRARMKESFAQGDDALDCFPLICLLELKRLSNFLLARLGRIKAPLLMIHAERDDFASIESAEVLFRGAGSKDKEFIRLKDSYHLIAIDNERDLVARKVISFLDGLSLPRVKLENA
jgi:carboxylesterase